jgi:hypothetical protein
MTSLKSLLEPVLDNLPNVAPDMEVEVLKEIPIETLYLALKEADGEQALWFYTHAHANQIQGLVDIDCWDGASFLPERFETHFKLMTLIPEERMVEIMKTLDPEVIVRGLMEWFSVEDHDPQNPPEVEENKLLITLDQKYALIMKTENPEVREMVYLWVNKLSAGDIDILRRHLESCKWEQPSDLEEHGYQFKKGRIEDMGFVDYYDSLALFARGSAAQLKSEMLANPLDEKAKYPPELYPGEDSEAFVETEFLPNVISSALCSDGLVRESLKQVTDARKRNVLMMELLRTINGVLAADKVLHEGLEKISQSAKRARDYLELGLVYIANGDKERATQLIQVQPLAQVLRLGWLSSQDLVAAARALQVTFGNAFFSDADQELLNHLQGRHPELPGHLLKELGLHPEPGTLVHTKSVLAIGMRIRDLSLYAQFFMENLGEALQFKTRPLEAGENAISRLLTGLFRQSTGKEFSCTPLTNDEWTSSLAAYDKNKLQHFVNVVVEKFPEAPRKIFQGRVQGLVDDINFFIGSNSQPRKPDSRFFKALVFAKAGASPT